MKVKQSFIWFFCTMVILLVTYGFSGHLKTDIEVSDIIIESLVLILLLYPLLRVMRFKDFKVLTIGWILYIFSLVYDLSDEFIEYNKTFDEIVGEWSGPIGVLLVITGLLKVIKSRETAFQEIEHMNQHDVLTGLLNRFCIEEKFNQIVGNKDEKKKYAILFLDLDRFKKVNDTMGHWVGDEVLKEVSRRIRQQVGNDAFISRLSGDEFLLFFELHSNKCMYATADKIIISINKPFHIGQYQFQLSCSVGISKYPDDSIKFQDLIKFADISMFKVKEVGGKGFIIFDKKMNERLAREVQIEQDLRHAIIRNELQVYYQPQFHLFNQNILGFEALVRWEHPTLGFISPGEFIPIAEKNGQIIKLGEWVLKKALQTHKEWMKYGPTTISVNVSNIQFHEDSFVQKIKKLLLETSFPAESLILEITESVAMYDIEKVISKLNKLKELGVKIAIDDFGKGYSSFYYLKRLPIHTIKIDKDFISDIDKLHNDREIVSAIIAMSHKLNLNVLAEGVETIDQMRMLKKYNCNEVQGFLMCKPLPESEIEQLLRNGNKKILFI